MEQYFINTTADKCQFNNSCLNCNCRKPCEVTEALNNRVLFIDAKEGHCNYKMSYGNNYICLCQVRKELYLKYAV